MLLLLISSLSGLAYSNPCPAGTVYNNFDKCYEFATSPSSFISAQQYCFSRGGQLAAIDNGFESTLIADIAPLQFSSSASFWLGGHNLYHSTWMWSDWQPISYNKWDRGQPSSTPSQCLSASTSSGQWSSTDCLSPLPFICSFPSNATLPPPTCPTVTCPPVHACPTTAPPKHCRDDWKYFAETDSCYEISRNANFSYGELQCRQQGGHLVSIHSKAEEDFVKDVINTYWGGQISYTWTGLNYNKSASLWQWTDGTPLDYAWKHTQPERSGYDCELMINDLAADWKCLWEARDCGTQWGFVCKRPA